jgi:RNA polymerase sigma-70 factor (ECF subfamily)
MGPGTDGQLLQAASRGDAQAFEALVHRHESALLRHARALVGESGGYEDVVQEVFLRLAQKPPELPSEVAGDAELEKAHLGSWLHRVTRNCCMDVLRSETRRKAREDTVATGDPRPSASHDGMSVVDARDTRTAVERGLERLPKDQHEVLVLRLLGHRSYREIADITGKKVGTVGWLVSEGLKALSRELAPLLALSDSASPSASASQAPRLRGELS